MSASPAIPPVPTDADAFDGWARAELDAWRLPRVQQVARAIWDDPAAHPSWRAVAGIWVGGEGGSVDAEELLAAAEVPGLPPIFAARLRAVVAGDLQDRDRPRAQALAEQAAVAVRDLDADRRSRLAVLHTAATVSLRGGRLQDAVNWLAEARELLGDEATTPSRETVSLAAVQLDVIGAALAHERAQPEAARQPDRIASLGEACLRQARGTAGMALAAPDVPAVVSVRSGVARVLNDLGAVAEAEPLLASVDAVTRGIPEALSMRFPALLALADCRLQLAGPEAALEVQEQAIEAVAPFGPSPMLAWAERGRALQLRAAGRHDEAGPALERAVDLLAQVGQHLDASRLLLEQARGLAEAGEDVTDQRRAEAAALVDRVLAGLDEMDADAQVQVEAAARDLGGRLASARLDHDAAVEHWQRLAELAPGLGLNPADAWSAVALELARRGDGEAAERQFTKAEIGATDGPRPEYHLAVVLSRRARVQRQAGEHADAAELLRVAVNHARVAEDPVLAGRLEIQLADALDADGQRPSAIDVLLDLRSEVEGTGPDDLVAALDTRLSALGHG